MKKTLEDETTGRKSEKKKLLSERKDILLLLSSSAFVTSLFCLFGPLQLYIVNISEMWFTFGDVFWPSLLTFLIFWITAILFGVILYRKRYFAHYNCFLCGLGLALYVQGNVFAMDYGILNGATINWGIYQNKAILNALIWIVLLCIPFLFVNFWEKWSNKFICYISLGLILVQIITTAMLCAVTDFSKSAVTDVFLSDKGIYNVSKNKNIIVFILDTFDKRYFEEVYNEEPTIVSFMDGFTYFSNATSAYPNTRPSLPYMLTGQHYLNEQPYTDYIVDAWENCTNYYQLLSNAGFSINIYTEDPFVSNQAKVKWIYNAESDNVVVSSYIELEKALIRFTSMRFFPDWAKRYIWSSTDPFSKLKTTKSKYNLFDSSTASFMERLVTNRLTIVDGNQYHVIHLDGVHMPYTLCADCTESIESKTSAKEETKGCLTMLREYINQLKDMGVYDNTCIIITGDHGFSDVSKTSPVLFVKGFEDSGAMTINDLPVSHSNLMGTVVKEINEIEDISYGQSVFDLAPSTVESRKYYFYTQNDSYDRNYMPDMVEYDILPQNNNAESFILTGKTYTDKGIIESEPYICMIDEPVVFQNSEALSYFVSGTPGYVEEDGVWSSGHCGRACFRVKNVKSDLLCHIQLGAYVQNDAQHVIVSSTGKKLYDNIITSNMLYLNFAVPNECIVEDVLILDFDYPDACSSISLGRSEDDMRDIAIKFWSITFTPQDETNDINFAQGGNAGDYYYAGWHGMEPTFTWSNEVASLIVILPEKTDTRMSVRYKTHPGASSTNVYYNDVYVGTLPHHDDFAQETIVLPIANRTDSDVQIVTFATDGATTSKEYYGGNEQDTRILGIAVSEIVFE